MSQLLCPLWLQSQTCIGACVHLWQSEQSLVKLRMGGLNLPIASESHVSYTLMTLMADAGDCSTTEKKNQTGLQGDQEDFWGWNQCAYYESDRLNRVDDELRAWRSTVITRKLQTFVPACKHLYTKCTYGEILHVSHIDNIRNLMKTWLISLFFTYLWLGQQSSQSSGRPGAPTRHCIWNRSVWPGWSGRSVSPACSSQCTRPPAPPGNEVTGPRRPQGESQWPHAPSL